jgi:hypothetical protein
MEQGVSTEHRIYIKFLVKRGKSGRKILEMLETVYGESAMKCRTVYKWADWFKEGRESIDENVPFNVMCAQNIQRLHDLVMSDRRITTRIITDKLGISN